MNFLSNIYYLPILMLLFLGGCKNSKVITEVITPPQVLYTEGKELLGKGKYADAVKKFSKVYFQSPGSQFSSYSLLMEAYSFFLNEKYQDSIDVLDNFIDLYPVHEDIAYAYYLKTMAYFNQKTDIKYDNKPLLQAKIEGQKVLQNFSGTDYASDIKLRMLIIDEQLAGKEMEVGCFYLGSKNPIAAILRFQRVLNDYDKTIYLPEALYRLVESQLMLGLRPEADKYADMLKRKFSSSVWYTKAYNLLNTDG